MNPRPSPWQGDALPLSYSRLSYFLSISVCHKRVNEDGLRPILFKKPPEPHLPDVPGNPPLALFHTANLAVAHVNNSVPDARSFWIVRNHQHRLLEFLVRPT